MTAAVRHLGGSLRDRARRHPWLIPALLFVGFTLVRLPLRTEFLVNWDAINFALGVESFDLGHHQPHAPGYIGYVAIGRALTAVTGDPNAALTLLSVVAGGVIPAATYALGRRFLRRRYALLAAVLLGTSPVVWYYSLVALTYAVAAAVTIPLVWAAVVARQERSPRHLYVAALLLSALGALRQTDLVLLLPVLVYAAWPFAARTRVKVAAVLAATSLLWLVPLLDAAGGPLAYLQRSEEMAALAGGRTWIFGATLVGLGQNLLLVSIGLVLGLGVGLLALPAAALGRRSGLGVFGRGGRRLLALWAAPALVIYLFVHTGQVGYILTVLPICALWIGGVAQELGAADVSVPRLMPARWRRSPAVAGVALVAVLNTVGFTQVPERAYGLLEGPEGEEIGEFAVEDGGVEERVRQFVLPRNDEYWRRLVAFVRAHDPGTTAVLALPASGGSFRHLGYYLEDYRVYGVGRDRQGDFGHLFTAEDGESDYSIPGLDHAEDTLVLPPEVTTVIVGDRLIQAGLEDAEPARRRGMEDGPDVLAIPVPRGTVLHFEQVAPEDPRLSRVAETPPRVAILDRDTYHAMRRLTPEAAALRTGTYLAESD